MEEPRKPERNEQQQKLMLKAFNFAIEFGFIIAIPLILFGYAGKRLDARFGTKYIVLIGILLAIATSTVWISKRIKSMMKDIK